MEHETPLSYRLAAAVIAAALVGTTPSAQAQEFVVAAQDLPVEGRIEPGDAQAPDSGRNGNGGEPGGITREGGGLVLNFNDASIDVVLDELSAAAGFVIVKQANPEGRVTLTSRQPVSADDAVALVNTVLAVNGFSAIQQGRILKIVKTEDARTLNIPVRVGSEPADIAPTDELITQVVPLRHAVATQLVEDLKPLIEEERTDITANASSNAIVLTDTSANVRRIVEIINALDKSLSDSVQVKVFALKFASATETATLINSVFGNLSVGPGGEGGVEDQRGRGGDENQRQQRRQQRAMMRYQQAMSGQDEGKAVGSKVNAAADPRTNSLVVTGPTDTLDTVAEVIAEIDSNPVADENVFVYRLRNSRAANIQGVLNSLFGNGSTTSAGNSASYVENPLLNYRQRNNRGAGSSGIGGGGGGFGGGGANRGGFGGSTASAGGGGGNRAFGQQNQQRGGGGNNNRGGNNQNRNVSRQAQQAAGALAGQVSIIADIDTNSLLVRTSPQYFDQVRGVLSELDRPVAQVLIKVLIAEVTHDDSLDLGAELSVLNLRNSGLGQTVGTNFNLPVEGASATGVVVQILEQDFSAAIRALEVEGKLDVLSRPYILASDNQVASITVGQEVPFITASRITDEGGIINTITYSDIGILLDVIPHVNPEGLVILDVAPEISTLTGTTVPISELVNAPVIAKRSAISRVGVKNGQTIVIGGLMEDRKTQSIRKVPLLGDIPIIGNAFKRTETNSTKTELLIFLTPHVASDPDRLDEMADDMLDGTQLVPNAVRRGAFPEAMREQQRGGTTGDAPAATPNPQPDVIPYKPPESTNPPRGLGPATDPLGGFPDPETPERDPPPN